MLKIGAIIQARMSSRRFPGKMLHAVEGKPLLQYLTERLEHCREIHDFYVATSEDRTDDPLEEFCRDHAVPVYRGSLADVASRFRALSLRNGWDAFVRVNGDSPLLDQDLIQAGLLQFRQGNFDLVTNVFPRTFPPGQSVEIIRTDAFTRAYAQMTLAEDREHVTRFFYQHPQAFTLRNFSSPVDFSGIHLSVDTPDDMAVFAAIIRIMQRPHWDYHLGEIIDLYRAVRQE